MNGKEKEQKEQRKQRLYKREKQICTLAHSVAEQIVALEDITYEESFWALKQAEKIIKNGMDKRRATISPEIRDSWGVVIGMSGANAPDIEQ